MSPEAYIRTRVRKHYGSKAAIIETWMDNRMQELLQSHGLTKEEMSGSVQSLTLDGSLIHLSK